MRDLVVDVSQAILNRTAMFTISMDTLETLEDRCAGLQVFGRRVDYNVRLSTCRNDARRLHDMLDRISQGEKPQPVPSVMSAARTLYLDPLYTLLAPLSRNDIVMILDLSPVTTPAWHSSAISRAYKFAYEHIAQVQPQVLAISHNTAESFRINYGFSKLIRIIPLYLPRHFEVATTPTYAVSPYILCVGSLEERKNLAGAIDIFRLSRLAEHGYELLIVGGRGHGAEKIETLAAATSNVRLAGFVSNDQLASLYAGATAFLYPSYLEGFGVPLVEALYAGLPCVTSCTGAAPEIGGDLVRYSDPDNHEEFASHLVDAVNLDPQARQDLAARSRARVNEAFRFTQYQQALRVALEQAPAQC